MNIFEKFFRKKMKKTPIETSGAPPLHSAEHDISGFSARQVNHSAAKIMDEIRSAVDAEMREEYENSAVKKSQQKTFIQSHPRKYF